jgi:hypothetical protein
MVKPMQPGEPQAGHYAMRLARRGIAVAVKIWFGQPIIDGEEQDRSPRWCAAIDGRTDRIERDDSGYCCRVPLDVFAAWPECAKKPISAREYAFLLRRKQWALDHAPQHPAANPREAIDVRAVRPFF